MTTFIIPAATYLRLATIAPQPDEIESRNWLRCVRIETVGGRTVAVVSNGKLLAGELIPGEPEGDGAVCVTIDQPLINMAQIAAKLDENLVISQAPGWTVITTTGGAMLPINGEIDGSGWPEWRTLLPADLPTKNNGCFSFRGDLMARLCASAPSGSIRCAKNIDMTQPTIVRDQDDENWFGMFMVSEINGKQPFPPATLPDWLK